MRSTIEVFLLLKLLLKISPLRGPIKNMRSIRRLFEKVQKENSGLGSVIIFNHIVDGKNFSHDRIARWFNVLVDKQEYEKSEKKEILEYVYLINIPLNRTKNESKLPFREEIRRKNDKLPIRWFVWCLN